MMRVAVLLSTCVLLSGCFVFDELDKGNKILDENFSGKPVEQAPAQKAPAGAAGAAGAAWWAKAKTLSGPVSDEGGKNPAVACTVGKTTKFMRKTECLSQGGRAS